MATKSRPSGSPLISNKGIPKSPLLSGYGSTCSGHQLPRPADPSFNALLLTDFVRGAKIDQAEVDLLRSKIRIELDARRANPNYSAASITTLRNSLNSNPIVKGGVATAATSGELVNNAIQAIGADASPSNQLRGAIPQAEPHGHKTIFHPAANQLNLNTNPYNSEPGYYTGGTKVGQHSPPYARVIDRKLGTPPGVAIVRGTFIAASSYVTLINNYKNLVQDCICHSDCNCNAVCACHNNCGCNY